jgi:hypothetical protein
MSSAQYCDSYQKPERKKGMKPSTVWTAIVLLAVGACGILDAAGIVDASQTIGQWWPVAVIGWATSELLSARRLTLGGIVCAGLGLALLADAQAWASDTLVWSALAVFVGLAILVAASLRRGQRNGAGSVVGGGAS